MKAKEFFISKLEELEKLFPNSNLTAGLVLLWLDEYDEKVIPETAESMNEVINNKLRKQ